LLVAISSEGIQITNHDPLCGTGVCRTISDGQSQTGLSWKGDRTVFDREKLPLTRRFPMSLEAFVYPSPESGMGTTVHGWGYFTLSFEETKDPKIALVSLEDIYLKLPPTRLPFDIDRDGLLECIDLQGFKLDVEAFDLEESGGEYNLESGHIDITFVMSIDPGTFLPHGKELDPEPMRFEVKEQGWIDIPTGRFTTHSHIMTVQEGALAGLTILGGQWARGEARCEATVTLGVLVVNTPSASLDVPPEQAPKEVWICPKTPIMLLWDSTNADSIVISPDVGLKGTSGSQQIPDATVGLLPIDRNTIYTADTNAAPGCTAASDKVTINVIQGGEEIFQTATYVTDFGYWSAYLPSHTYDQQILVDQIIIDSRPDGIVHPSWRLDHIFAPDPPVGTVIPALNNWTPAATEFRLPGEYRFTPTGPSPTSDQRRPLYFRLRVKCRDG
jgi:hypothetical protein